MLHESAVSEASAATHHRPLIIVTGPTASGKSELALQLAKRFGGELINADSRQVYCQLNVGTAKPSVGDRRAVPHHLIDVAQFEDAYSVADFVAQADLVIADIRRRNALPIVVGGTGLYVRALVEGLFAGPSRSSFHDRLVRVAQRRGLARCRRRLDD